MSEHGFHVHGPHDHELEHEAQRRAARHGRPARGGDGDHRHGRRDLRVHGRPDPGQRRPVQERAAIKKTEAVEPVGLLPGQEQPAEPRRARRRARARGAPRVLRAARSSATRARRTRSRRRPRSSSTNRTSGTSRARSRSTSSTAGRRRRRRCRSRSRWRRSPCSRAAGGCSTASTALAAIGVVRRRARLAAHLARDAASEPRRAGAAQRVGSLLDLAPQLGDLDLLAGDRRSACGRRGRGTSGSRTRRCAARARRR